MTCAEQLVEACAHDAWKADLEYRKMLRDDDQQTWDEASEADKALMRDGVIYVLRGVYASERHYHWAELQTRNGWVHGTKKDEVAKTDPSLVPWYELPAEVRVQEMIFDKSVLACVNAFVRNTIEDARCMRTSQDPPGWRYSCPCALGVSTFPSSSGQDTEP